jgi:putative DNA primase/helicase
MQARFTLLSSSEGEWCFPPLVATPTMRPDGSLLSGQPLISIDNVNGDLRGDAICQAIEGPVVGSSASPSPRRSRRSTLLTTGDNIRMMGDLARRVLRCRLGPRTEGRRFRHRPVTAVLADRGRYVMAALAVVRAYAAAGRPGRAQPLVSFELWSDLVRSALLWLGRADPVDTLRGVRDDDPNRELAAMLFAAWRDAIGLEKPKTAVEIIQIAGSRTTGVEDRPDDRDLHQWQHTDLRRGLLAIACRDGVIDAREFGKWLSRHRDRIVCGLRLEGRSDRHGHAARWWLVASS